MGEFMDNQLSGTLNRRIMSWSASSAKRHVQPDLSTLQPNQSPLFMALDDPVLHRFISYLTQKKDEQESNPGAHVEIELTRGFIDSVRESFKETIVDGERHLHSLAHLLASQLLEGDFELHSNVIGVLPDDEDRPFLIRERISQETLFSVMDIDLGNQMLRNFRYLQDSNWVELELSANFVEYLPAGRPTTGVNRLTSRVKAEEELWTKVADEMFHLDKLVPRDKHLRQYSKYIKDVFGIKIVCEDERTCLDVHEQLKSFEVGEFSLDFVETKNYLTCPLAEMKKTGWKALKSVVLWHDRLFEIQVQPLSNYHLEIDHMAGPSHRSFKLVRDRMRDEIAHHVPLYGFYRDLLRMLFTDSAVSFESEHASINILENQ
jgi:ppGpp synthetase/RelA/SpoT-type nucleotidyltranferase